MLDYGTLTTLNYLMASYSPQAPYLTFDSPSVAEALSSHGQTHCAMAPFSDEFCSPSSSLYVKEETIYNPLAYVPRNFGLIHARWFNPDASVFRSLINWLRPGGVLLVELPESYPARSLPHGPYRAVSSAVAVRYEYPPLQDLPGRLMRHGMQEVGARHEQPSRAGYQLFLQGLIEMGSPWNLDDEVLADWPSDPSARSSSLMNVLAWGVKPEG